MKIEAKRASEKDRTRAENDYDSENVHAHLFLLST